MTSPNAARSAALTALVFHASEDMGPARARYEMLMDECQVCGLAAARAVAVSWGLTQAEADVVSESLRHEF